MPRKLILLILVTSGVTWLVISVTALCYGRSHARRLVLQKISAQGDLIQTGCASALSLNDPQVAAAALSQLQAGPEIISGQVFSSNNVLFAAYFRTNAQPVNSASAPTATGNLFEDGLVLHSRPLFVGGQTVGTLVLHAGAGPPFGWPGLISIAAVALLSSFFIGLLASRRFKTIIFGPIVNLTELAETVGTKQDYSLRATKQGNDEIGDLAEGFNWMLTEIQKHDDQLRASEQRFRQLAESIGAVFWMTNADKTEMIYISPGYEEIWGRACASLLASPRSWVDSIHPEDRDRVLKAALTNQTSGKYEEEYRIIRPNGSSRIIHDRAFPVRNQKGEVYRVAGIAEDITERKKLERDVIEICDREQRRLGQDLHDAVCQQLVSIAFATDLLRRDLIAKSPMEADRAGRIAALLDDAISQTRNLSHQLCPLNLAGDGLGAALRELADGASMGIQVVYKPQFGEDVAIDDHAVATHLYRIAQEAVQNAIKHARATRIHICLLREGESVCLTISDNGTGIARTGINGNGMGMSNMRYRTSIAGGRLEIKQSPAGGTIVSVTMCAQRMPAMSLAANEIRPLSFDETVELSRIKAAQNEITTFASSTKI